MKLDNKKLRTNPVYFIENIIGIKLVEYQKEWLRIAESKRKVCFMAFRSSGKSSQLFVNYVLFKAITNPKTQYLVISKTLPQAREILSNMRITVLSNPLLKQAIPKARNLSWSKTEIEFSNHSRILSKAYNENVRGWHVHGVLIDELGEMEDHEVLKKAVFPTIIANKGFFIGAGTPKSELDLLHEIERDPAFKYIHFDRYPAEGVKGNLFEQRYPDLKVVHYPDRVEIVERTSNKLIESYNNWTWSQEFLLKPISINDKLFPESMIEACIDFTEGFIDSPVEMRQYFMGCLTPGQNIITKHGLKKIEKIKVGDKVLTHNGKFENVTKTSVREYAGDVLTFKAFGQATSLTVTPEHPLFVSSSPEEIPLFIKAENVKIGEFLTLPNKLDFNYNSHLSEIDLRWQGLWLAEGWRDSIYVYFAFHKKERHLIDFVKEYSVEKYGCEVYERTRNNCTEVRIKSKILSNYLGRRYDDGAKNKEVPFNMLGYSKEKLLAFINGYVEGDGHVLFNKEKNEKKMMITTPNFNILNFVRLAFLSFEKGSSMSYFSPMKRWSLNIHEGNSMTKFNYGLAYHKIKEINKTKYEGLVYNFETETSHSYCTDSFCVHNCDFAMSAQSGSDYTVITILEKAPTDKHLKVCLMERYKGLDYSIQKERIIELAERFQVIKVLADESSFGKTFVYDLRKEGVPIEGYAFNSASKEELVKALRDQLEKKGFIFPFDANDAKCRSNMTALFDELGKFGIIFDMRTKTVMFQGTGQHDDTVISLALANYIARHITMGIFSAIKGSQKTSFNPFLIR